MADRDARRRLLAQSDELLNRIEELRLAGVLRVPEQLQRHVARLAAAVDQRPPRSPGSLPPVQAYLFRLQAILMAGGRSRASPRPSLVPPLALPPPDRSATDEQWQERVRLVVQRAHDRVSYLHHQLEAARRMPQTLGERLVRQRGAQLGAAVDAADRLRQQAERALGYRPALDAEPALRTHGTVEVGTTIIDLDAGTVHDKGRRVALGRTERAYLVALASNQGRVLSKETLLYLVYGDDPKVDLNTGVPDVHLTNIRRKLGHPSYLGTVRGVGFAIGGERHTPQDDGADRGEQLRQRRQEWARNSASAPPSPSPEAGRSTERRSGR